MLSIQRAILSELAVSMHQLFDSLFSLLRFTQYTFFLYKNMTTFIWLAKV
jgi:hypothetical protein